MKKSVIIASISVFFLIFSYSPLFQVMLAEGVLFPDIQGGSWYSPSVVSLAEKSVVKGYPDGTFRPDDSINRAEMAAIMDRYHQYLVDQYFSKVPGLPSEPASIGDVFVQGQVPGPSLAPSTGELKGAAGGSSQTVDSVSNLNMDEILGDLIEGILKEKGYITAPSSSSSLLSPEVVTGLNTANNTLSGDAGAPTCQ